MPGYKWSDILTLCLQERLQAARNIVNKTISFFDAKYLVVGVFSGNVRWAKSWFAQGEDVCLPLGHFLTRPHRANDEKR